MLSCFLLAGTLWLESDRGAFNIGHVYDLKKPPNENVLLFKRSTHIGFTSVDLPEELKNSTLREVASYLNENCS